MADKDTILDIMPIQNEGEIMEPTQTTSGLEEQEQFPEVLNYNPVLYGWEIVAQRGIYKRNSSTFNKVGAGSFAVNWTAQPGFPVLVPAIALEFTTDSDEIQGNVRVEFNIGWWDGADVQYWEGQFKGLNWEQKGKSEERLIMVHHLSRPLRNGSLLAPPTTLQRYVPICGLLANSEADACRCDFNPINTIDVNIISSVATLKTSVEIITPNSKLWNVYVESLLAHNLNLSLERYSVNQETKELIIKKD